MLRLLSTLAFLLYAVSAQATTYWGSVSGGAGSCAAASGETDPKAYRTFAQVVSCAAAGDTIKLKDGTYAKITLTAGSNVVDGTSSAPITLTAENAGLAFIQGDGAAGQVLKLVDVDWWIVENLRIENIDNAGYTGSEAQVVYLFNSNNNIIRKNIIKHPNRWGNNAALNVQGTGNTIEANDVLFFHRNGIELFDNSTENNRVRLNYVGQTATNLAGSGQPNDGYVCYDARNNTFESNVFQSFNGANGGGEGFTCWGSGNKFYGNISIGAEDNAMSLVATASITVGASGYIVKDFLATGMGDVGLWLQSPLNVDVQNVTSHTSLLPARGFLADDDDSTPVRSFSLTNGLFIDTTGVLATPITTVAISYSQEWGTSSVWGTGTSGRTNSPPSPPGDVDPAMGSCRTHLPASSPYKGKGLNGVDLGANVLYEYVNGVRTSSRLWNHTLTGADRGKMLFGPAVISGVNDSGTGKVRATVHQDLGFGNGTCQFPADYGVTAGGSRYWADAAGNNVAVCSDIAGSSDPGSYGTISRAVACAVANGDEVYVKPGTYTSNTTTKILNPGINGGSITIRGSDPSNWPIIRPATTASTFYFVEFSNVSNRTATFKYLRFDALNLGGSNLKRCLETTTTATGMNVTFEDFECSGPSGNAPISAFRIQTGVTFTARRGYVHDWIDVSQSIDVAHCFYISASNSLIEHVECRDVNGHAAFYSNSGSQTINGGTFRYNKVHLTLLRSPIFFQTLSQNITVHDNVLYDWSNSEPGIQLRGTNNKVFQNALYDTGVTASGISLTGATGGCASGCVVANNIVNTPSGTPISGTTGATLTNNLTTGNATDIWINPASGDFSLKESSAAIDNAATISGFTAHGCVDDPAEANVNGACDNGPLEAPVRLSAVVENVAPTIYSITFSMPSQSIRDGVGLQTCTVANFAVVVAGSGATENSCAVIGSGRVDLTLAAAVVNGNSLTDAMTRSSAPTLMDNVCLGDPNTGGCLNSKIRTYSAQSGTNQVGGATPAIFTVIHYRCLSWYSSLVAIDWIRQEDADNTRFRCPLRAGGFGAVAMAITADVAEVQAFDFHFNRNGSAFSTLSNTASPTAIAFADSSAPSMGDGETIPTAILTDPNSDYVPGKVVGRQASEPTVTFNTTSTVNIILLVKADAAASVGDFFCIQPAKTGQAPTSVVQSKTPCFEIVQPSTGF